MVGVLPEASKLLHTSEKFVKVWWSHQGQPLRGFELLLSVGGSK